MKVVKLNRKYKFFQYGFTHALKFDMWDMDVQTVENAITKMLGPRNVYFAQATGAWATAFGARTSPRPYWIYLRDEAIISWLILGNVIKEK